MFIIRENPDLFLRIVQDSDTMVLLLNKDFKLLYFNNRAEKLLGEELATHTGDSILDIDPGWDRDMVKRLFLSIDDEELPLAFPDIELNPNTEGKRILGITVKQFTEIEDEKIYFLLGQDITQKRKNEQARVLDDKLRSMGELAGGIAHDLSSPVHYLYNNLDYIKASLQNLNCDNELIDAVNESLKGLEQIKNLTTALKKFLHPDDSKMKQTDIRTVINDAASISRNEWKNKAKIQIHIPEELPVLCSSPTSLTRVLINLIINSAYAISEAGNQPGKINITAKQSESSMIIEISDNGPGIPPQIRDRIFEPFFTTKPRGSGSGQGLAIAYSIIAGQLGGEILFSENKPTGSIFTLVLPLKE